MTKQNTDLPGLSMEGLSFDPETRDPVIWSHVFQEDEYRTDLLVSTLHAILGTNVPLRVLDVGAHRGFFARRAALAGFSSVHCVEAWSGNIPYLRANVEDLPGVSIMGRVGPHNGEAIGVGPAEGYFTGPDPQTNPANTGGVSFLLDGPIPGTRLDRNPVPVRTLDVLLWEAREKGEPYHVVKMDVEGMEWPVLFSSLSIRSGEGPPLLVAEVHSWKGGRLDPWREFLQFGQWPPAAPWPPRPETMVWYLSKFGGYTVAVDRREEELSLLWAIRNDYWDRLMTSNPEARPLVGLWRGPGGSLL